MNKRNASILLAAALLTGCAAASRPSGVHVLPDHLTYDRVNNAYVDVGNVSSADELLRLLQRVLARHGYYVTTTHRTIADGFQFHTHWKDRPVLAAESFNGAQRARTRLVVEARPRADRFAVTVFAVSYTEDASGRWRETPVIKELQSEVRDIGRALLLEMR